MAEENKSDTLALTVSNLLNLLTTVRAEKALLEVGYTPALMIRSQRIEIDGPDVTSEAMEELLRGVMDTRGIRTLRKHGTIEVIYGFGESRFLIRVVDAFGVFRLDLAPIRSM